MSKLIFACTSYTKFFSRGEPGIGKWSVVVKDTEENEHNGTFTDWRITLWGESIDASGQDLLPMPNETDDDDHDVVSAPPTTVSIDPGSGAASSLSANPTDHQDRPINAKPSPTDPAEASEATKIADITELPEVPNEPEEESEKEEHFLPHYFPTFGVSKRTQIWIYGALAIIFLFCAGLGTYIFIVRRRRNRSERDAYEFEMLDDGEEDANGDAGGKRTKRRAGELYDAFAGESDEDDQLLSDEDDEEAYHDTAPIAGQSEKVKERDVDDEKQ